jgi:putative membrane protein
MMGYGYGMGAVGWIAMTVFWVGLITLVIWVIARVLPAGGAWGDATPRRGGAPAESAEDILDRRFAAGELDEETYRSMRATLRSARTARTEPQ